MKTIAKDNKTLGVFEKIQVEDGFVIVDKVKLPINNKDCFKMGSSIVIAEKIGECRNGVYSIYDKNGSEWFAEDGVKIISASKSLIDKYQMNVPEFISKEEQEIERLVDKESKKVYGGLSLTHQEETWKDGFIAGYKANQNKFSEENLRKAIEKGFDIHFEAHHLNTFEERDAQRKQQIEQYIQSLQQKEVYLEVEEVDVVAEQAGENVWINKTWQLKVTNNKIYEI